MLFATDTFVGVLKANVASAVCTRHSRASVLGSVDALGRCFPMFWGHLTLKPLILKGLAARGRDGSTFFSDLFMAFYPWTGTFKEEEGFLFLIQYTLFLIQYTCYLILDPRHLILDVCTYT